MFTYVLPAHLWVGMRPQLLAVLAALVLAAPLVQTLWCLLACLFFKHPACLNAKYAAAGMPSSQ